MLSTTHRLCQSREEEIAAQVFEDEAVIMRLTDGAYFNMNRVGGVVWEVVEREGTLADVVLALTQRFEVSPDQARTDAQHLVEAMIQEGLVTPSHQSPEPHRTQGPEIRASEIQGPEVQASAGRERLPYETPLLLRHDDVADLLALDPPFGTDCLCGRDRPRE